MNTRSSLNGIVAVDKPGQMSSAKVVARIKSLLQIKKAGHAGTLDPLATGVLICCLNKATRLVRFLMAGRKTYHAEMQLGVETDTQDATGKVVAKSARRRFAEETIRSAFIAFEGDIAQSPPAFSALKHQGVPLYRYARKGIQLQKPPRQVSIYRLLIQKIDLPFIGFEVQCSAGTYIRTLCADIGRHLGCGGHLTSLRRIESSGFTIDEAIALPEGNSAQAAERIAQRVIPMGEALRSMPSVQADQALITKIRHGQSVSKTEIPVTDIGHERGYVKIVDPDRQLLAVVQMKPSDKNLTYSCVFV